MGENIGLLKNPSLEEDEIGLDGFTSVFRDFMGLLYGFTSLYSYGFSLHDFSIVGYVCTFILGLYTDIRSQYMGISIYFF